MWSNQRCTRMSISRILVRAAALISISTGVAACDWMRKKDPPDQKGENERRLEREAQLRRACASELTYDRLKEYAFDEAQRIRGSEERTLDDIATASAVRMEEPVVKSRDENLNVTVCTGRFILELPPGAENAFDGERRLSAQIEYAAQAAVDGSGMVYHMTGAEPIIYRLATVGGIRPGPAPVQVAAAPAAPAPSPTASPAPQPPPPAREPAPSAEPRRQPKATARPSYDCRHAGTRTEIMVCANPALAAHDRRMASVYYAEMAEADGQTRRELRRSRDRFLARRESCRSEACVASVYEERIREIRGIAGGD